MKKAKYLLLALLVFVAVFAFVSCGNLGDEAEFNEVYAANAKGAYETPLTSYKDFFNNGGNYNYTVVKSSGDYAVFKKTAVVNNSNGGFTDPTVYYEYWNVVTETKLADFSEYSGSNTSYSFPSIYDGLLSVCQTTYSAYNNEYNYSYSLYNANGSTVYSYETKAASIDYVGNDLYVVRKNGAESFDLYKDGQYVTTYYIPSFFSFNANDYTFTTNYAIAVSDAYAVYYDRNFNQTAVYYFPTEALNSRSYAEAETYVLSDGKIVFIGYETLHTDDSWYDFTYSGLGFNCCFEIYDPVEDDTYDIDCKCPIRDIYEVEEDDYMFAAGVELLVEYYNVEDGVVDTSKRLYATMDREGEFVYDLSSFVEDQTGDVWTLGNGYYYVPVVGGYQILDGYGNAVKFVSSLEGITAYDFGFLYEDDGVYTCYDKYFSSIATIDTEADYAIEKRVGEAAIIYSYENYSGYKTYTLVSASGTKTLSENGTITNISPEGNDYFIVEYKYSVWKNGYETTEYAYSVYLANGTSVVTGVSGAICIASGDDYAIIKITNRNTDYYGNPVTSYTYKKIY